MSSLTNIQGIIPATPVMYTDRDCLTVDFDAVRAHFRYLVSHEILRSTKRRGAFRLLEVSSQIQPGPQSSKQSAKEIEALTACLFALRLFLPGTRPLAMKCYWRIFLQSIASVPCPLSCMAVPVLERVVPAGSCPQPSPRWQRHVRISLPGKYPFVVSRPGRIRLKSAWMLFGRLK
jgi:hypothetical protein